MAKASKQVETTPRIAGEWLCRDVDSWRVLVPCQGGSGRFYFSEYGGVQKALEAARQFQAKALDLLHEDREYRKKYGETPPKRPTVNIRNRTGIQGVGRSVYPNAHSKPRIVWFATWMDSRGRQQRENFSTAEYPDEATCKRLAIEKREEMQAKYKRGR